MIISLIMQLFICRSKNKVLLTQINAGLFSIMFGLQLYYVDLFGSYFKQSVIELAWVFLMGIIYFAQDLELINKKQEKGFLLELILFCVPVNLIKFFAGLCYSEKSFRKIPVLINALILSVAIMTFSFEARLEYVLATLLLVKSFIDFEIDAKRQVHFNVLMSFSLLNLEVLTVIPCLIVAVVNLGFLTLIYEFVERKKFFWEQRITFYCRNYCE